MKIESRDIVIDDLLKGSYFFIPRFQRPYSWEEDNINEFWQDIVDNMKSDYFIGSMVFYKNGQDTLGVVDGQQRITTITILLSCIRDFFKDIGEEDKAKGLHKYIEKSDRDNNTRYILRTETSFPFLQEKILKYEEPEIGLEAGQEEKAIQLAYEIFRNKIGTYIQEAEKKGGKNKQKRVVSELVNLRDAVLDLSIILITLSSEEDAYLIFETLNTRGKDLSLSDLVKNHFTRQIPKKSEVDHASMKWNDVIEALSKSSINLSADTFIVHSWSSRYEAVTQKKAFKKIKSKVDRKHAREHLDDFLQDSEIYRSIFEPTFQWNKGENSVANYLRMLNLFNVSQPVPAILSLIRAYRDKKIKYSSLNRGIKAIEFFHFSFTAVTSARSSGGISSMYSSFGRKMFESTDSNTASKCISDLIDKLRDRKPSPSEFFVNFEQILFTQEISKQRQLVRYILINLDRHFKSHHIGPDDELTIEHLVSQSETKHSIGVDVIGKLGNLILIDQRTNGKLKNKGFAEKEKILTDSGYKIPLIFQGKEVLTKELIDEHTRNLAQVAYEKVWAF